MKDQPRKLQAGPRLLITAGFASTLTG